jgi:hypothetical protein
MLQVFFDAPSLAGGRDRKSFPSLTECLLQLLRSLQILEVDAPIGQGTL